MYATIKQKDVTFNIDLQDKVGKNSQNKSINAEEIPLIQSSYDSLKNFWKEKKRGLKKNNSLKSFKPKKKKDFKNLATQIVITHSKDTLKKEQSINFLEDAHSFLHKFYPENEILASSIMLDKEIPYLQVLISYFDEQTQNLNKKALQDKRLVNKDYVNTCLYLDVGKKYGLTSAPLSKKVDHVTTQLIDKAHISSTLNELQQQLEETIQELKSAKQQVQRYEQKMIKLENEIRIKNENITSIEEQFQQNSNSYEMQLEQKESVIADMQQHVDATAQELSQLQQKLQDNKITHQEQLSLKDKQILDLQMQLDQAKEKITTLEKQEPSQDGSS